MSNVLLTFGDSWPAGARIDDKSQAFPKLIAEQLNMDLVDLSRPATSLDHAVMAFLNFLEKDYNVTDEYTALFCITDISRNMAWRQNTVPPERNQMWRDDSLALELQINNTVDELSQIYFKHLHSSRLELFDYHRNIILLNLLCKKYKIKDYYVHNFYNPQFEFRVIETDNFYPGTLRQVLESVPFKEYIPLYGPQPIEKIYTEGEAATLINSTLIQKGGHPSVAGHKQIADVLTDWIKNSGR